MQSESNVLKLVYHINRNKYFHWKIVPGLHARLQKVFLKFSKHVGHLPKRFSGILNWRWLSSNWDLEQHNLTPSLVFPSSFGSSFLFWYLAISSFANVGHSAWSILIVSWSARTIHIHGYQIFIEHVIHNITLFLCRIELLILTWLSIIKTI